MEVLRTTDGFYKASFLWTTADDIDAVNSDGSIPLEKFKWCRANLRGEFSFDYAGIHIFDESDALAFRLRWEE